MNSTPNQPEDDAEKLKKLTALLDRLAEGGFVKQHGHMKDVHAVDPTERGWRVIRAIHDIEDSIPKLSDTDRFGMWNFFRLCNRTGGNIRPLR